MPQIAAGLNATQTGISTYVGRTETPNQQATITIGVTGLPTDSFGPITASSDGAGTYYSEPGVSWLNSVDYGRYVYMVGLRGDGTGNMVYARIEIQAKMRFRQTISRKWQRQVWFDITASPSRWWRIPKPRAVNEYNYYTIRDYNYYWQPLWQILAMPTTLFWVQNVNFQIMTVTNKNFSSPGYLFANNTVSPSANVKVSSRTFGLADFNPFGTYTFKTAQITGNNTSGTSYTLYGPTGAPVVWWDEKDGSYPWNENSTQVSIGVAADRSNFSATIDDFTVRDI